MATTESEIYVGKIFRRIEAKSNVKLCEVCNRHYNETAYYKHFKRKIHFAAL